MLVWTIMLTHTWVLVCTKTAIWLDHPVHHLLWLSAQSWKWDLEAVRDFFLISALPPWEIDCRVDVGVNCIRSNSNNLPQSLDIFLTAHGVNRFLIWLGPDSVGFLKKGEKEESVVCQIKAAITVWADWCLRWVAPVLHLYAFVSFLEKDEKVCILCLCFLHLSQPEQCLQKETEEYAGGMLLRSLQQTQRVKDPPFIHSPDKSQKYQYCITLHKILLFALMDSTYLLIQISYCKSLFTI